MTALERMARSVASGICIPNLVCNDKEEIRKVKTDRSEWAQAEDGGLIGFAYKDEHGIVRTILCLT